MATLYIPGAGVVDMDVARAHATSKAYDERCSFKRDPLSGQYCTFMQMPRGWDPPEMPVKAWDHIPTPDELTQWLSTNDTQKHGDRFRVAMNERNAKRKAESLYKEDQISGQTAEYIEHIVRKQGEHPFHKSLRKVGPKQSHE